MSMRFTMCLGTVLCAALSLFGVPGQAQTVGAAAAPLAESIPASQGNSATDAIKKLFSARFPEVDVTAVSETPFPGLYEVQIGMDVVYTDAQVSYLLQGSLIDAKSRVDLTSERLATLSKVSFASLPLNLAIKQVKGTGAHKMAVFEDPNCVYCKQLHHTLKDIDNVTVYTFLLPILTPDSVTKARDIWCAKDQAGAWTDWMVNGKAPAEAKCNTPTKQILALGKKLMIQGTPAIFFADGTRVNGTLPLEALREKLDSLN
ncbi:MAG: DsbC family protein [Candidimonas sp.]|nr:MAG: DsbC family protein [Candidimonas sp.]TAM22480.1 MAG: DsbC family protein [Candidimonas sp.]